MKTEKLEKLVANLYDKTQYVTHIKNLKQALNHELVLNKIHRVITFNQKYLFKPYIKLNTELRQKAKDNSEKDFFKLMNNAVFGKTMENVKNIEILNLSQQRGQGTILYPNLTIILSNFSQKIY